MLREVLVGGAPRNWRRSIVTDPVVRGEDEPRLTRRERAVLERLDKGDSVDEAARHLSISTSAVSTHLANIQRKRRYRGRSDP